MDVRLVEAGDDTETTTLDVDVQNAAVTPGSSHLSRHVLATG